MALRSRSGFQGNQYMTREQRDAKLLTDRIAATRGKTNKQLQKESKGGD